MSLSMESFVPIFNMPQTKLETEYAVRTHCRDRMTGQIDIYVGELLSSTTLTAQLLKFQSCDDKTHFLRRLIKRNGLDVDEEEFENDRHYIKSYINSKTSELLMRFDPAAYATMTAGVCL